MQNQGQNYNQQLSSAQLQNQAQAQQYGQASNNIAQQYGMTTGLNSAGQATAPNFMNTPSGQTTPANYSQLAQNQYQGNLNAYNQQIGQQNQFTSGLFGLGAAAITAFSDERLKSNIVRVGTHPAGFGVYEYDIFGHRERGVMAQEVFHVKPEAVRMNAAGYLMVNYGSL